MKAHPSSPVEQPESALAEPLSAGPKTGVTADRPGRRISDRWHFYAMWALLLGYVSFMPTLGFMAASSLLLVALFRLLGERN
jgi:hypothetical protein